MFVLYLDEFGHDGIWQPSDPRHRHHPLFGLGGIAIPGNKARDLDRGYLRLKAQLYAHEIQDSYKREKKRPERFEPKQLTSRRDFVFAMEVVNLVRRLDGHVFALGLTKATGKMYGDHLYTHVAGRLLVAFERYLRSRGGVRDGCGVIVLDRRDEARDLKLLGAVQSFLFSSALLNERFARISETPLLVRSEWYHGVQAADTIARAAGAVYRKRYFGHGKHGARLEQLGKLLDAAAYKAGQKHTTVRVSQPHDERPPSARRSSHPGDRAPLSQPVLAAPIAAQLRTKVSAPPPPPMPRVSSTDLRQDGEED